MVCIIFQIGPLLGATFEQTAEITWTISPTHNIGITRIIPGTLSPHHAFIRLDAITWLTKGITFWTQTGFGEGATLTLEALPSILLSTGIQITLSTPDHSISSERLELLPSAIGVNGLGINLNVGKFIQMYNQQMSTINPAMQRSSGQMFSCTNQPPVGGGNMNNTPLARQHRATSNPTAQAKVFRAIEHRQNEKRADYLRSSKLF